MADESLSALLDGECSADELERLLDAMERSPELKRSYSRLCLTRDALEGTRIARNQHSICDGVMSRLDAAPLPVAAPAAATPGRRPSRRLRWKPAGGLAAAAAVGALAVLVMLPQAREQGSNASPPGFGNALGAPVSLPLPAAVRPRNLQRVAASAEDLQQEDDLSNYLMEHNSTAAGRGMGGTLSFARFAAHNAVYRPQPEEQR
jgi:negative regulator of sigma E activity